MLKAWGTNLAQIFLFPQVFGYNPANCLLTNIQTFQQLFGEWYDGLLWADDEQIPRFHLFWQSKETTSGIVLHVLPSVSKASIPPIHNSTNHGSATISLINQFDRFHSTFTGFATLCSSMTPMTRQKIFACKTSSYSQTTEWKPLMPGHMLHEAYYYVVTVSAARCNPQYSFQNNSS